MTGAPASIPGTLTPTAGISSPAADTPPKAAETVTEAENTTARRGSLQPGGGGSPSQTSTTQSTIDLLCGHLPATTQMPSESDSTYEVVIHLHSPMRPALRIETLGRLRVYRGSRTISRFRTRKTASFLAYLALHADRTHPRETLGELFWPESDPTAARHSISKALSSLRQQLEPPGTPRGAVLWADRESIGIRRESLTIDAGEFQSALTIARASGIALERRRHLIEAIGLYKGDLLPGFYEDWVMEERERLSERRFQALRDLQELEESTGADAAAVEWAQQAVDADPLREGAVCDLMAALTRAGRDRDAIRVYRKFADLLDRELGLEPDERTQALCKAIQAGRPAIARGRPTRGRSRKVEGPGPEVSHRITGTASIVALHVTPNRGLVDPDALHDTFRSEFRRQHGDILEAESGGCFTAIVDSAGGALRAGVRLHRRAAKEGTWSVRTAVLSADLGSKESSRRHRSHAHRIAETGHPGQILCCEATCALVRQDPDSGSRFLDLGLYSLGGTEEAERIFQLQISGAGSQRFPKLDAPAPHRGNLPLSLDRFFGRQEEMRQLRTSLLERERRLVTIVGPGGIGKTRMSLELAATLVPEYRGGVWFVPLADTTHPERVLDAMCDTLDLPGAGSQTTLERIIRHLAGTETLILLDNLEHLLPEAAPPIGLLLEKLPAVRCLVTSRIPLKLPGETILHLLPLQTPTRPETVETLSRLDSVRLFVDRAQAVRPDFQVSPRNAASIAQLCARLEGIPLALELAAARIQVLTPSQMLQRLARRLDFLASTSRSAARRHRTMRAAVEWSYHLLPPELRRFLTWLTPFRGGWTLEAAEEVCDDPLALDHLEQLRECSLISVDEVDDAIRFQMLETVREYAAEKLKQKDRRRIEERHSRFYLGLARAEAAKLDGPDQRDGLDRLAREQENFRSVLDREPLGKAALELATCLTFYWTVRGQEREGRERLGGLLERETSRTGSRRTSREAIPEGLRGDALYGLGMLGTRQGDFEQSLRDLEASLEIYRALGDERSQAKAQNAIGLTASEMGDGNRARSCYAEALRIHRALGDEKFAAQVLTNLGVDLHREGDLDGARDLYAESLRIKRDMGAPPRDLVTALMGLGNLAELQGDIEASRHYHEECLELSRSIGDDRLIGYCLANLGSLLAEDSKVEEALESLRQSLRILHRIGDKRSVWTALQMMALLPGLEGRDDWSVRLMGAAEVIGSQLGTQVPPAARAKQEEALRRLEASLGPEAFSRRWEEGRVLDTEAAVAYALGKEGGPRPIPGPSTPDL